MDGSLDNRNSYADGGGDDYDSANDFIAFDKDSDWRGDFWRLAPSDAPWTLVRSEAGHPNGADSVAKRRAMGYKTLDIRQRRHAY